MPMGNPTTIRRFAKINGAAFPEDLAARVDAAEHHGFVVAACGERERRHRRGKTRGKPGRTGADQEMAAVEAARLQVASAGAGIPE